VSEWEAPGESDDWITPKYIFDALGVHFDVDVAAPRDGPRYVPADRWIFKGQETSYSWGGFVWMNPPFGARNGLEPWLATFIAHGNGIALVPDRTSAPWFQSAAPQMDALLFLSPKVKFERPDGSIGKSPGSGTALMAIGSRAIGALYNARKLGWLVVNAPK
jgi:hypothetical protein